MTFWLAIFCQRFPLVQFLWAAKKHQRQCWEKWLELLSIMTLAADLFLNSFHRIIVWSTWKDCLFIASCDRGASEQGRAAFCVSPKTTILNRKTKFQLQSVSTNGKLHFTTLLAYHIWDSVKGGKKLLLFIPFQVPPVSELSLELS